MRKDKLIKEGYKLIEVRYSDSENDLIKIKKYCFEKYNQYKIIRGKSEYPAIIKYEIYIKEIKFSKSTQKKYRVRWYDNGVKEGIWKSNSVYELKEMLRKLNIFPELYIEVE